MNSIEDRASFSGIRYANCWEDAQLLLEAFSPLRGKKMVSIASAGDNTLALLTLDPSEILAVDLSQAQLACLDLRCAAFALLSYEETLSFLGVRHCISRIRWQTYRTIRTKLLPESRVFWDTRQALISKGIIHIGKFEHYFSLFRRFILPLVHGKNNCLKMTNFENPSTQYQFYRETWDNRRWRALFHLFFSRTIMGHSGRDPEFFRYVEGSVADRILNRTELCLAHIPGSSNPWLQYIMTGNFQKALPPYLQENNFETIRSRLGAIHIIQGNLLEALGTMPQQGNITGYNLSDIFEYMNLELFEEMVTRIIKHSAPGSRLAYWNMLAPRDATSLTNTDLRKLKDLSADLFSRDRAFFYSAFHVDEVIPSKDGK